MFICCCLNTKSVVAVKIIMTSDGSHSLLNEELNETYHSIHGAIQESLHVFIKHGLEYVIQKTPAAVISMLEIGFGTGLNALLTWEYVQRLHTKIKYTTIEAWPLSEEVWSALNYSNSRADDHYATLHRACWDNEESLDLNFNLLKLHVTLQEVKLPLTTFDLVYYDAFAPSKQPELWELPLLEKVLGSMKPGGTFVTYCAKGQLKRNLNFLGVKVETLSGPPGKKEMVRALKI
jgi:tRNA U34 5-methylaminomethyl-2-thiouridine-forming methyltransferase MnmC